MFLIAFKKPCSDIITGLPTTKFVIQEGTDGKPLVLSTNEEAADYIKAKMYNTPATDILLLRAVNWNADYDVTIDDSFLEETKCKHVT